MRAVAASGRAMNVPKWRTVPVHGGDGTISHDAQGDGALERASSDRRRGAGQPGRVVLAPNHSRARASMKVDASRAKAVGAGWDAPRQRRVLAKSE